ncbi:hypothetical protein MKX01_020583 [Papaver californicum]|nr:hypothetical protein MKX01_020583 [Papaver californicum]
MGKIDDQRRGEKRRLPPSSNVAPWLVIPHGKYSKYQAFYNICADNQLNKKASEKFIPELSKREFHQKNCHQGWLIVLCHDDTDPNYGDCFLWNPQTLDTIQLPSLVGNYELDDTYWLTDCILTSPPQINTNSSSSDGDNYDKDPMVYLLFDGGHDDVVSGDVLLFCHPGEKEWRRHELNIPELPKAMLYLKNKLHIMCFNPVYYEIEVQVGDGFIINTDSIAVTESATGGMLRNFGQYYVESFGEVFRIQKWSIHRGDSTNCCEIETLKLDFASMAWENVKSLDDRIFFIGHNTQLSCWASDLGFSKGCMYYTQHEDTSLYKYDMEDHSILLSLPCPDLPTPWFQPEWLMITTTQSVDDKRQAADCILGKVEHMDKVIKVTENIPRVAWIDEKDDIREARLGILASDDFVWLVSHHLHTLDYIHLRAVSKRYRAILNLKRSSSAGTFQTTDLSPWLFVNPLHNNEKYLMNIPEMCKGSRIRFSKDGWLLMSNSLKLLFHNPFTRSSIKLPDLPDNYDNIIRSRFSGISFSSLPTSSDCTVFAFDKPLGDNVSIFFIKRGEEHWRYVSFDGTYSTPNKKLVEFDTGLNNPVFYNGAFYCLDLNGALGVSKQENGIISWEVLAMLPRPNCEFIYESYLCEGKLLCVLLGHLGKWVRIFRLSNTRMVWVEVENLGQHMLCVSITSCISAVAPTSQMKNKIYFPRLSHEEGILFYSLDSGIYHCVGSRHSAKDYRDSKEMLWCSWIEPNWSQS